MYIINTNSSTKNKQPNLDLDSVSLSEHQHLEIRTDQIISNFYWIEWLSDS